MTHPLSSPDRGSDLPQTVVDLKQTFTSDRFSTWWAEQEHQRNQAEGYGETRNDATYQQEPSTHSPSNLLRCHRNVEYRTQNAPAEEPTPSGVFAFGVHFEEIIERFLKSATPSTLTIRNPVPVEYPLTGDITITGSTDPVLFNESGVPELLVECKSTSGLSYRSSGPLTAHRAQAHAYSRGLARKFDRDIPVPICYVYGGKTELKVLFHFREFDNSFWKNTVRPWIVNNTKYRARDELAPPVDPDQEYMCSYCEFSDRCGYPTPGPEPIRVKELAATIAEDLGHEPSDGSIPTEYADCDTVVGDTDFYWDNDSVTPVKREASDEPIKGFLPCQRYPKSAVVPHLLTFPDVCLTPTIAAQHPALASVTETDPEPSLTFTYGKAPQRQVHDWRCPDCGEQFPYQPDNWDGSLTDRPQCPDCDFRSTLRGPYPHEVY